MATDPSTSTPVTGSALSGPPTSKSFVADRLAALAGAVVMAVGIAELLMPLALVPFTGLEPGKAAAILGAIWSVLGLMLILGGAAKLRAITIAAAEFLLILSACALAVMLWSSAGVMPITMHGAMAGLCLVSGGLVRLTDRSELRKEIIKVRELARLQPESEERNPPHD